MLKSTFGSTWKNQKMRKTLQNKSESNEKWNQTSKKAWQRWRTQKCSQIGPGSAEHHKIGSKQPCEKFSFLPLPCFLGCIWPFHVWLSHCCQSFLRPKFISLTLFSPENLKASDTRVFSCEREPKCLKDCTGKQKEALRRFPNRWKTTKLNWKQEINKKKIFVLRFPAFYRRFLHFKGLDCWFLAAFSLKQSQSARKGFWSSTLNLLKAKELLKGQ